MSKSPTSLFPTLLRALQGNNKVATLFTLTIHDTANAIRSLLHSSPQNLLLVSEHENFVFLIDPFVFPSAVYLVSKHEEDEAVQTPATSCSNEYTQDRGRQIELSEMNKHPFWPELRLIKTAILA